MGTISVALCEQNILSHVINYPDTINLVNENYFSAPLAKKLFVSIRTLSEQGVELSTRNILTECSKLDDTIRPDFIDALRGVATEKDSFNYHYSSLRKGKAQLDIQTSLTEGLLKESAKKELDIKKVMEFRDLLNEKLDEIQGNEKSILTLTDWLDKYEHSLNERRDGSTFYSTGDGELDKYLTTAFEPGYFNLIAGHSGIGKSTFALKLNNNQINRQIPALRISNEMTDISDMDRLIAQRHRLPTETFYPKRGDMEGIPDFVFDIIKSEREKFRKNKYFRYVYLPNFTLDDLESMIKITKREMGVDYLAVTVDLLTKVEDFNGDNKASRYEDAVNKLDTICKRTKSSLLGVIQLKRPNEKVNIAAPEDLEKFRPQIQEIKNSGALEERARIVFTIFRARYWAERILSKEDPMLDLIENVAEIDILKQNLGEVGSRVKYLFEGKSASLHRYVEAGE